MSVNNASCPIWVSTVNTTLPAGTENQLYCYDELNRLTWAGSPGSAPCGTLTAGTLTAANSQQSYVFGPLNRLTTGPSGRETFGDPNHLDAVTSASGYTASYDAAGNMTATALYAPYGAIRYGTGTMLTTRSYTSMVSDPSGLLYDHARFYNGGVGQRISPDTMQRPNRYGYVARNPETYTDSTGHWC